MTVYEPTTRFDLSHTYTHTHTQTGCPTQYWHPSGTIWTFDEKVFSLVLVDSHRVDVSRSFEYIDLGTEPPFYRHPFANDVSTAKNRQAGFWCHGISQMGIAGVQTNVIRLYFVSYPIMYFRVCIYVHIGPVDLLVDKLNIVGWYDSTKYTSTTSATDSAVQRVCVCIS